MDLGHLLEPESHQVQFVNSHLMKSRLRALHEVVTNGLLMFITSFDTFDNSGSALHLKRRKWRA
jgi:hypothetical protein